ncbi:uncharacterized protein LOC111621140 [Centruroides sculpturatus]|uniref:uncharacterized protein LOC111621140 n=1 Tax=Centruroides sculpturatus TaxID=218467 RepID=UPI000C6ED9F6|nr:uncharacterized protein LOC111621140 [Centruroides sculpturatus]
MSCTWKICEFIKMLVAILLYGYLWGMFGGLTVSLTPVYEDGKTTFDSRLRILFCALHGVLAIAFTACFILHEFQQSSNNNETSNENQETSPLIPKDETSLVDRPFILGQSRENVYNKFYTKSQSTANRNAVSFDLTDDLFETVSPEKSCDSVGQNISLLDFWGNETGLYTDDEDDFKFGFLSFKE